MKRVHRVVQGLSAAFVALLGLFGLAPKASAGDSRDSIANRVDRVREATAKIESTRTADGSDPFPTWDKGNPGGEP
jgi:hypothetical protein